MNCPSCGTPALGKFCKSCGAQVTDTDMSLPAAETTPDADRTAPDFEVSDKVMNQVRPGLVAMTLYLILSVLVILLTCSYVW